MKTVELKEKGAIFFERIEEGFSDYKDEIIVLEEGEAEEHFKKLIQEYGQENAYADFYYYKVSEEARLKIDGVLSEDELEYIHKLQVGDSENIIFSLDETLLQIIVKLNAEEMLFSTIYFLENGEKKRSTWWGNYNKEYYCFTDKESA